MEQNIDAMSFKTMQVNVAVATVWTTPDHPREMDEINLQSPVKIEEWLDGMTTEDRLELCTKNILQTQVLYGENVYVIEEKDGWAYVFIPYQPSSKQRLGYPGWIPISQLSELTPEQEGTHSKRVVQVKANSSTLYKGLNEQEPLKNMVLSFGTRLPYVAETEEWVIVSTIEGNQKLKKDDVHMIDLSSDLTETEQLKALHKTTFRDKGIVHEGQILVELGSRFIGLPYLWGGTSAFGYDCSGFVYSMHQALGITIPRDASDQAKQGKDIACDSLQAGDLLFFAYEEGKGAVHHVGMYVGNGEMIHSPKTGKTIEIIPLEGTLYEKELCCARRFWA